MRRGEEKKKKKKKKKRKRKRRRGEERACIIRYQGCEHDAMYTCSVTVDI